MIHKTVLMNDVIRLRRVFPSDAELIYQAVRESMPELSRWMYWCHPDFAMDDSKVWADGRAQAWKKGKEYDFIIEDRKVGQMMGVCGLNQVNRTERLANLGYWIRTSTTGRGIATKVVPLLARFGFEHLRLNRIEIVAAVDNIASQRVAEKAGALREGVLRQRLAVGQTVCDAVMFSLIQGDLD